MTKSCMAAVTQINTIARILGQLRAQLCLGVNEEKPGGKAAQDGDEDADLEATQERCHQNGWEKSDEGNIVEDPTRLRFWFSGKLFNLAQHSRRI